MNEGKAPGTADLQRALRTRYGAGNYNIRPDGVIETRRGPGSPWRRTGRVGGRMAGRPSEMGKGKKITLHLDAETLAKAEVLGNGNISLGVRRAFQHI